MEVDMLFVVAYDIVSDERRARVSNILVTVGARVQYSVFECDITDGRAVAELRQQILDELDEDEDQVRIYPIPSNAERAAEVLGRKRLEERTDFWIV